MTDATVPTVSRDERVTLPAERAAEEPGASSPRRSRALLALWAALVLLLVAFLWFGSVRIGAGNWVGRRMDVPAIWDRFTGYLADQGATPALVTTVTLAAVVALAGSALVVLLAFTMRDDDERSGAGDHPDR